MCCIEDQPGRSSSSLAPAHRNGLCGLDTFRRHVSDAFVSGQYQVDSPWRARSRRSTAGIRFVHMMLCEPARWCILSHAIATRVAVCECRESMAESLSDQGPPHGKANAPSFELTVFVVNRTFLISTHKEARPLEGTVCTQLGGRRSHASRRFRSCYRHPRHKCHEESSCRTTASRR